MRKLPMSRDGQDVILFDERRSRRRMEQARMTAQPSRDELLAAIVEWSRAQVRVNLSRGHRASDADRMQLYNAEHTLIKFAAAALADRAEGKGHG
jgi:hypothetical protein